MARKIKETPVLKGKDARRFEKLIAANKGQKVPTIEKQRILAAYKRILAASTLV